MQFKFLEFSHHYISPSVISFFFFSQSDRKKIYICRRDSKFHHDRKKFKVHVCETFVFSSCKQVNTTSSKRLCIGNQPRQIDRMTNNRINNNISHILLLYSVRSIYIFVLYKSTGINIIRVFVPDSITINLSI